MARSRREALEKVVKMLRLARAAGSEAEAETALTLAQKLMYAHGLNAAEAELPEADAESEPIDDEMIDHASNPLGWREYLAAVVAENFRCAFIVSHPRRAPDAVRLIFVGRAPDVAAAGAAYRSATVAGETLAYRHVDENGGGTRAFDAYLSGFLAGLDRRFRENVTESGLAIRLDDEVRAHAASLTNAAPVTDRPALETGDQPALRAGYADGFAVGGPVKRVR